MLKFRRADAFFPNLIALVYISFSYLLAWFGLLGAFHFLPAILLFAHAMVLAAYLLHECAHNTLFESNKHNARLGSVLSWMVGACYLPFEHLREKHMRHHLQREDVLLINAHALLEQYPLLKKTIYTLSWLHIPAFDLYTHVLSMIAPFFIKELSHFRQRVIWVATLRFLFFLVLTNFNPWVPVYYMAAYTLMVLVLNFMDSLQHTYTLSYDLLGERKEASFDKEYEESHTFSNLLSQKFPLINLLVLNFCYHNVHHQKPNEPWYHLPDLHQKLYSDSCAQVIPFKEQVTRFHSNRLARLNTQNSIDVKGIDGVSFLVGV